MAARSPVQCRPNAARQLPTSKVRLWASDPSTHRIFELHHRVSQCQGQIQLLRSYAGPLESRRRIGKRHITATIPSIGSHQPMWYFAAPTSSDTWTWEAPTTAAQRKEKNSVIGVSVLWNRFLHWLESPDTPEPYIEPPSAVPDTQPARAGSSTNTRTFNVAEVTMQAPSIRDALASSSKSPPIAIQPHPWETSKFRWSNGNLDEVDMSSIQSLEDFCCFAIHDRIRTGKLSVTDFPFAFNSLEKTTIDQLPIDLSDFVAALIRGAPFKGPDEGCGDLVSTSIWMIVAEKILESSLEANLATARWFRETLDAMPETLVARLDSRKIYKFIERHIDARLDFNLSTGQWMTHGRHIGMALRNTTLAQQNAIYDHLDGLRRSAKGAGTHSEQRRRAVGSLIIKIFSPTLSRQSIINDLKSTADELGELRTGELWQLAGAWLARTNAISTDAMTELWTTTSDLREERIDQWDRLLWLVERSGSKAALEELEFLLRAAWGNLGLLQVCTTPSPTASRIQTLQRLAAMLNSHKKAYELFKGLRDIHPEKQLARFWNWQACPSYLERIIKDPDLEPRSETAFFLAGQDNLAKRKLLRKMAKFYMEAGHLNERQLLRRLAKCGYFHRQTRDPVPLDLVGMLTDVVTRDLERGNWGRTERLMWVVQMVAKNQGPATALRVAGSIAEWRRVVSWARMNLPHDTIKERLQRNEEVQK